MSDKFLIELIKKYPNSIKLGQAIQYWVYFKEFEFNKGVTNITKIENKFLNNNFQFSI